MPRKISIEERIKRIEENKEFAIKQAEKRIEALYNARIALLREKGLPKKEERVAPRSIEEIVEKGKDRYVFFRQKFYEFMGDSPEMAKLKAERDWEKYRFKWLVVMKG